MGMLGSGTNVLATPLLAASGVTSANSTLLHIPTIRTQAALKSGRWTLHCSSMEFAHRRSVRR
jgi:hypothetical protein